MSDKTGFLINGLPLRFGSGKNPGCQVGGSSGAFVKFHVSTGAQTPALPLPAKCFRVDRVASCRIRHAPLRVFLHGKTRNRRSTAPTARIDALRPKAASRGNSHTSD